MMNAFLRQFSRELPTDVHAAMILDHAGWHLARALKVPKNVTLILLPPKSPELNRWKTCGTISAATAGLTGFTRHGTI